MDIKKQGGVKKMTHLLVAIKLQSIALLFIFRIKVFLIFVAFRCEILFK